MLHDVTFCLLVVRHCHTKLKSPVDCYLFLFLFKKSPDHINARNKKSAYFIVAIQAVLVVYFFLILNCHIFDFWNLKSNYFFFLKSCYLCFHFQVTVIILIVSSALCTKVKPCELQTALDFIFVKYTTHPCKYNAIKDMSSGILALGISMLCWIVLLFVQTIYVYFGKIEEKKRVIAKIVVSAFW